MLVYIVMLAGGIMLFLAIRSIGERLIAPEPPSVEARVGEGRAGHVDVVLHVLSTLAVVIGLGHILGSLCRCIGQPAVIGEVIAGIVMGPSLLGEFWPEAMQALIPGPQRDPHGQVAAALMTISQLGVLLYMFLVGLELNPAHLRHQAQAAVFTSHASIVAPFLLGCALALWLYPLLSHRNVPFTSFALFMGVSMAITAFPVLARILTDQSLQSTRLGVMALACAAADDVTAWCLLALAVGVAQARIGQSLLVTALAVAFIAVMFWIVRPLVAQVCRRWETHAGSLPPTAVAGGYVAVLLSALITEAIGIHAVFGAFLLGAVVPYQSRLARDFIAKLQEPVTVLLLPAFFAYTGMRTQIGLVSGWSNWALCAVIILVATLGKFGGTLVAARWTGQRWRDAAALGILMNTRGLMELIVLNIGLDLGVISPTLFTMMVLMALATTVATSPILKWLLPTGLRDEGSEAAGVPA
jgi:Kef-type K+ transport system membrane component KefB